MGVQQSFSGRRAPKNARKYRTQCKICDIAVYEGDAAVWLSSPVGISHEECAR